MGQGEVQNWMKSTPGHDVQMRYPGEWKFAGISALFLQAFFAKDSQNVADVSIRWGCRRRRDPRGGSPQRVGGGVPGLASAMHRRQ